MDAAFASRIFSGLEKATLPRNLKIGYRRYT
jgi:hypothetical protein